MVKRLFDIAFSFVALVLMSWLIFLGWIAATLDTHQNGFFLQKRVGQYGKLFTIIKLRTIKNEQISSIGRFLRDTKIDELPQFINVLFGSMSVVGPRPDIQGYYDCLQGEERKILELKPGLTSEASLKYFNEEQLLSEQENSLEYNDRIIFPDKVRLNLDYYYNKSLFLDLKIIFKTLFGKKA
ncbi:sugar transferase [Flavobacterium sp. SM15]|uniref:sugar transferase n=1 Tax=Flavobacterium sp. SM15 TaxID=2908005 RepID=UPI001EDA25A2|nr:sugar transferase [Flavobacterium sp. SM15]MCG2611276.1 sugar transferase [Flavobacterium sp. SM15]